MYVQHQRFKITARLLCGLAASIIAGCGSTIGSDGNPSRSGFDFGSLAGDSALTIQESDPNDLLQRAQRMTLSADPLIIRGSIDQSDDVDVYDLGPVGEGDHVMVAVSPDDTLPAAVAAFDDTGATLLVNDHRNVYLGRKGPFIDIVIRRPSASCFIALSTTPGYDGYGGYALAASKEPGASIPDLKPDAILLVFGGAASARIGGRNPVDVPPFDARSISENYAGQTKAMMAAIVRGVRDDYRDFNVSILSTSEGTDYDQSMSRVFFGTYDAELLGVAEGVDEYNATDSQEAIVFTDTFAAFMVLDPSMDETAQAIANVASHEAGHLLGLVHTADPQGIMDVTASLSQLLENQYFKQSPLDRNVFPVGYENEVQMLLDSVGGDAQAGHLAIRTFMPRLDPLLGTSAEPSARAMAPLSSCCLRHRQGK